MLIFRSNFVCAYFGITEIKLLKQRQYPIVIVTYKDHIISQGFITWLNTELIFTSSINTVGYVDKIK